MLELCKFFFYTRRNTHTNLDHTLFPSTCINTNSSKSEEMPCVACLIVTTTGRVLVQWELDTTLPFHYTQLGLLIASLFQFSKAQEYSQLELRNGYTLVACSDVISQISTVVVCKTPVAAATASSGRSCKPQMLNMARLKGLVILKEFLRCYQDQVDTILIESKADAQEMAEKYTLTSALGGMRSNDDADDGTMDVFLTFQNEFMSAILEDNSTENIRAGISDSVAKMHTTSSIEVTRQFLMNADTGSVLYSLLPAPKLPGRHCYLEDSLPTQQLLKRVAQALSYCFPILQRTSLLTRNQEDSHVGFSNPSISSTTIILRIAGDNQKDASLPPGLLHIAVQMFTVRVCPCQKSCVMQCVLFVGVLTGLSSFRR